MVGEDYTIDTSTVVTFAAGATNTVNNMGCIMITIVDDDIYEENQDFSVTIESMLPTSLVTIGSPNSITKTIQDNNGSLQKIFPH